MNALGIEPRDQVADVEGNVHHQKVGAAAGTQHGEGLLVAFGVGDAGALVHRDLARGSELASERADDQESHDDISLVLLGFDDFGHGHAQLVLDQHDFAACDQTVVDVISMASPTLRSSSSTAPGRA